MRRVLGALLLGALIFAAPVAAKVVNVTNPMTKDLDAAFYSITRVSEFQAANAELGTPDGNFGVLLMRDGSNDEASSGLVATIGGVQDPSTGFLGPVTPGSLYLRHVDASHGELWFKVGPAPTDWQRIAP